MTEIIWIVFVIARSAVCLYLDLVGMSSFLFFELLFCICDEVFLYHKIGKMKSLNPLRYNPLSKF